MAVRALSPPRERKREVEAVPRAASPREREDLALVQRLLTEAPGTSATAWFQMAQVPQGEPWADPTQTDVDAWIAEDLAAQERARTVVVRRPPVVRRPGSARMEGKGEAQRPVLRPVLRPVVRLAGTTPVRRVTAIRPLGAGAESKEEKGEAPQGAYPARAVASRTVITPSQAYGQEEVYEQEETKGPDLSHFDWNDLARYSTANLQTVAETFALSLPTGATREDLEAALLGYASDVGLLEVRRPPVVRRPIMRPVVRPPPPPPVARSLYVPERTDGKRSIVRYAAGDARGEAKHEGKYAPPVEEPLGIDYLMGLPLAELQNIAAERNVRPRELTKAGYLEALAGFY